MSSAVPRLVGTRGQGGSGLCAVSHVSCAYRWRITNSINSIGALLPSSETELLMEKHRLPSMVLMSGWVGNRSKHLAPRDVDTIFLR